MNPEDAMLRQVSRVQKDTDYMASIGEAKSSKHPTMALRSRGKMWMETDVDQS